jgi:hypothetical protein
LLGDSKIRILKEGGKVTLRDVEKLRNKLTIKANECEHLKQLNSELTKRHKELIADNESHIEQIQ